MTRLLVTGGAGFIGSNLCIQLKDRHPAWKIVALDNLYRRGSELNLSRFREHGVEFVHGDVRRLADVDGVGDFTAMIECSAEPSVAASRDVIVPVNLMGAYNCFEAAAVRETQVIFLSTSRVYPIAQLEGLRLTEREKRYEIEPSQPMSGASNKGIAEEFPLAGARTMYGASKLAAETLLAEYEMPWTVNRCGVIAGPWQLGKVDQGVFTHWMLSHHFGRQLSYIGYGGTGKQVRDVLHIDDLVDLVEEQLGEPHRWAARTFNVGGGHASSLSLLETTELCQRITGVERAVGRQPTARQGDVPLYISDCSALFEHTTWRPTRSPERILADISNWITDNHSLVSNTL